MTQRFMSQVPVAFVIALTFVPLIIAICIYRVRRNMPYGGGLFAKLIEIALVLLSIISFAILLVVR